MEALWVHEGLCYREGNGWEESYVEVTHSGRTTNRKNLLRSHQLPEYRDLYGDEPGGTSATQISVECILQGKLFSAEFALTN